MKRDIELLRRVHAAPGDEVVVLDVSLDCNRTDLCRLLDSGVIVRYFDHHRAGEIPQHARLEVHIEESATVCTSLLVDRYLHMRFRKWAIVAAFGDNLHDLARELATSAALDSNTTMTLERLGTLLNYNAYGQDITDLHFDPALLANEMLPYADPLDYAQTSASFECLTRGYEEDMQKARTLAAHRETPGSLTYILPDEKWPRRAIGVLANELRRRHPERAVAVLSPSQHDAYTVSVRVPADAKASADELCCGFPTGGGRRLAAGINHLCATDVDRFIARFESAFA